MAYLGGPAYEPKRQHLILHQDLSRVMMALYHNYDRRGSSVKRIIELTNTQREYQGRPLDKRRVRLALQEGIRKGYIDKRSPTDDRYALHRGYITIGLMGKLRRQLKDRYLFFRRYFRNAINLVGRHLIPVIAALEWLNEL